MKYIKVYNIFSFLILIPILFGCESNDNPVKSVYIPKAVNKKVLIEYFSNSACVPCIDAHNYFIEPVGDTLGQTINDTAVIFISWQFKYPNIQDSLYWNNPIQNAYRANYYQVTSAPNGQLDGNYMGSFSAPDWTSETNTEMNTTHYLSIFLSNSYDTNSRSGTITATVQTTVIPSTNDNVIHFILTESKVLYLTAPNGITKLDDVMRYMITDTTGVPIDLSGTVTKTVNYNVSAKYKDYNCHIVVFIQSISAKKVYGVEKIRVRN